MKNLLFRIALIGSLTTFGQDVKNFDWNEFELKWNKYLDNPTKENGMSVYEFLPDSTHIDYANYDRLRENQFDSIFDNGLIKLQKLILEGDTISYMVAYRSLTVTNGLYSEMMQVIIGQSLEKNPTLFLKELNNYKHLVDLTGFLGMFTLEYVDDIKKQRIECEKRIKLIESVKDKKLEGIKEECLKNLRMYHQLFENSEKRSQEK